MMFDKTLSVSDLMVVVRQIHYKNQNHYYYHVYLEKGLYKNGLL